MAKLARDGFVRFVRTTNFDRLTEQGLDAAGVAHDVWHSPDAMRGGVPLPHGRVVGIKLHEPLCVKYRFGCQVGERVRVPIEQETLYIATASKVRLESWACRPRS